MGDEISIDVTLPGPDTQTIKRFRESVVDALTPQLGREWAEIAVYGAPATRTAPGGTIPDPPRADCPTCHRTDCPTLAPNAGDEARAACAAWCARRTTRRG